ncbi:MAG: hypothetical protein DHS20C18_53970 [Saprospiraceae bacterium]|nr:MAG: hypothetical protein DHS20C18_53970 [Saprospiraceae bacterium]
MRNYEVTIIVDPVLSGDEIKATAQTYIDHLEGEGCTIVHTDNMGLRTLAYPINKRNSGVYYCVEFEAPSGEFIDKMELALRRDERIMRFLTVSLDKFGVKYNDDKRKGLIGKKKKQEEPKERADDRKPAPKKAEPAKKPAEAKAEPAKKPAETKVEPAEKPAEAKVAPAEKPAEAKVAPAEKPAEAIVAPAVVAAAPVKEEEE